VLAALDARFRGHDGVGIAGEDAAAQRRTSNGPT
jgi:hypothetical protein